MASNKCNGLGSARPFYFNFPLGVMVACITLSVRVSSFSFVAKTRQGHLTGTNLQHDSMHRSMSLQMAAGEGFERPSVPDNFMESVDMTYGKDQLKVKDLVIDDEGAMNDFFTTNVEWHPLFRSILSSHDEVDPVAHSFLSLEENSEQENLEFDASSPWKELSPIPSDDSERAVVGAWLDAIQEALLNIPVDESNGDHDALDNHFVMEGKRMLATSRFHVLPQIVGDDLAHRDQVFMTCWSEMAELRRADEPDTGSVVLLPECPTDVKRFTDMNVLRPLSWLGLGETFEVSSFTRGDVPAIRILHKLSEVPSDDQLRQNRVESTLEGRSKDDSKEEKESST